MGNVPIAVALVAGGVLLFLAVGGVGSAAFMAFLVKARQHALEIEQLKTKQQMALKALEDLRQRETSALQMELSMVRRQLSLAVDILIRRNVFTAGDAQEVLGMGALSQRLREVLSTKFQLEELEMLCADLGVEWHDVQGNGLSAKALHLVQMMDDRGRLHELMAAVQRERPNVNLEC